MRLTSGERREQIITEAIQIIHETGFSSLSIRELASRVGISEPAIYRHFKNKDDIIMGILNKMQEFGELIQQKLISVEGELEKIRQLFLLQLAYFEENQAMTTIMLSEEVFHLNEKLKHKLALITNSRYRMLMDLIKSAQAKKIIIDEDADNLALIIMGTVRVIIFQWKLQDFRFSLVQRGKSVVNMLLAMLTVKK
ncbi:MAG TPA: TetR/AcrR family transcriptional regulator [bacterium]|nr:TetR/AcrR family transcriptional regulator [bacterium]